LRAGEIMVSTQPVRRDPDDGPDAVLERALRLEIAGYWPWRSAVWAVVLHAAFGLCLYVAVYRGVSQSEHPAARQVLAQIFVPARAAPPPPERSSSTLPGNLDSVPLGTPAAAVSPVAVDLSAIGLSFPADVRNQLPAVVRAQGGVLALLDKDNQSIARYIFRPPDWQAEETTMDVTGRLRILMDPPQKWPVFREISARSGLDLDAFRACAIFDMSYRRCLQTAIRGRVPASFSGHVSAARLAFRADRPCGVEVLDVSLAADAAQSTGK
jgi:hypothetical protein